jgi:hypothetical protein
LVLLAGTGCADEVLGVSPFVDPPGQLAFPLGITIEDDVLFVSSSNFNQVFNAGFVGAYDLDVLARTVGPLAPADPGDLVTSDGVILDPAACRQPDLQPSFPVDLSGPFRMVVRTPPGGGQLRIIDGRLWLPTRFDQTLVAFDLDLDGRDTPFGESPRSGDLISCRQEGEARLPTVDCSLRYLIRLGADDPFDVTSFDGPLGEALAVSHLEPPSGQLSGAVSVVPREQLEARLRGGTITSTTPVVAQVLGLRGTTTARFFDVEDLGPRMFLSSSIVSGASVRLAAVEPDDLLAARSNPFVREGPFDTDTEDFDPSQVFPTDSIDLQQQASARSTQGLAVAPAANGLPQRIYVTVRILEQIDSDNSAVVVLALGEEGFEVQSVFEVGEEIGPPVLSPFAPDGRRWLYVPDVRGDRLYVLDVTNDQPVLLNELRGRAVRQTPSGPVSALTLASPYGLAFDEREVQVEGRSILRRLLYVTNFENSTLAVVDVSDPNPGSHCLVARLGRLLDATQDPSELGL